MRSDRIVVHVVAERMGCGSGERSVCLDWHGGWRMGDGWAMGRLTRCRRRCGRIVSWCMWLRNGRGAARVSDWYVWIGMADGRWAVCRAKWELTHWKSDPV